MDITLSQDCNTIVVSNDSILTDISTGSNNNLICDYILDVDYNCCNSRNLPIRALHSFSFAVTDCGTTTVNSTSYLYYDITITTSLAIDCVKLFNYENFAGGGNIFQEMYPTDYTFRFHFQASDVPAGSINVTGSITTKNDITYNFSLLFQGINPVSHCVGYTIADNITYPTIPDDYGIILDTVGETITFTPITFGQISGAVVPLPKLLEGVYCITVKGVNKNCAPPYVQSAEYPFAKLYSESKVLFVDCDDKIKCAVTQLAATCDSTEPLWIYETLVYNNECQVLSCEDACNLYTKLNEFINNNCKPIKSCNC